MKLRFSLLLLLIQANSLFSQISWQNVDSLYQPLPLSIHVYYSNSLIDTGKLRAFYLIADIKDKNLDFTTDTTYKRRLTPSKFYEKNDKPLVVVNGTFFSFETNQNLNVVIKKGKLLSYNVHTIAGKGKDTLIYRHPFGSAIGISKKRNADVAWLYSDSSLRYTYARQSAIAVVKDSSPHFNIFDAQKAIFQSLGVEEGARINFGKWKMKTAIGGGPVLIQSGEIKITNNEELKFAGKAINDKHPRTAMGYTADNRLIIMVVEGRNPSVSDGVSLIQLAQLMKDIGCEEALNLDGGGSSCLLINGKETIKVSDKTGQRPIPAVFIIADKKGKR